MKKEKKNFGKLFIILQLKFLFHKRFLFDLFGAFLVGALNRPELKKN